MTIDGNGNAVITTKDLREQFDLPHGTILESTANIRQEIDDLRETVDFIWVRVFPPKQRDAEDLRRRIALLQKELDKATYVTPTPSSWKKTEG